MKHNDEARVDWIEHNTPLITTGERNGVLIYYVGDGCSFEGEGVTLREAIDSARSNQNRTP